MTLQGFRMQVVLEAKIHSSDQALGSRFLTPSPLCNALSVVNYYLNFEKRLFFIYLIHVIPNFFQRADSFKNLSNASTKNKQKKNH